MEGKQSLSFNAWKQKLGKDCELRDKLDAFHALGDYVLSLLWESGVDPSVDGTLGRGGMNSSGAEPR